MKTIYLMGSLRNPTIPELSVAIRKIGFEVFDDWYSPGPKADDHWRNYSQHASTALRLFAYNITVS